MLNLNKLFEISTNLEVSTEQVGTHIELKFSNGYGASIINYGYGSNLGLWELAVVNSKGLLDYSTPITDDVLGHLNEQEVLNTVNQIRSL